MTEQLYTNIPPLRPCMCGHGDHYQINGRCLTPGCGCAGRTVDKTGASDVEFRARVAAFDAAPTPPECDPERVETVARALVARCENRREPDGQQCTGHLHYRWGQSDAACDACGARCGIAVAAWTEVRPSPAEEAVKRRLELARIEGRAESLNAEVHEMEDDDDAQLLAVRAIQWEQEAAVLRAALASPAPQGEVDWSEHVGSCRIFYAERTCTCRPSPAEEAVNGVALIAAERRRQIEAEGWTPEHDAEHNTGRLALAAAVYAVPPEDRDGEVRALWPWRGFHFKPTPNDRVRELVKAGALIAAEIDRLRAALASPAPAPQGEEGQR